MRRAGESCTRSDSWTALTVVLAIVLLFLVVIFVPRPNIRLTNVRYETSSCDQATSSVVATAYVTLTNGGKADGYIVVRFHVDNVQRATGSFYVSADATVDGSLMATITGCYAHRYGVETCYPAGESATC